ncbi:MAG: alpha/beta fold hydrolase [Ornithinibacter sp.]
MPAPRRVDVRGVVLSVVEWRCPAPVAPLVVLLPGTGLTARSWDAVAASLCGSRSVLAVDLRGHGQSDWPGAYSIALMAQDVGALLEGIAAPVDLVGHSLGGLVALRVAAARRGRVRRLVLEDVGMPHPRRPDPPTRPEGDLRFDWRVVEQVRPEVDDPDPGWPAVVTSVVAPSLVLAGGPRSFVPAEHVAELVAALPDGRSVTLDTGHEVHEADPERFTRELLTFLGP